MSAARKIDRPADRAAVAAIFRRGAERIRSNQRKAA